MKPIAIALCLSLSTGLTYAAEAASPAGGDFSQWDQALQLLQRGGPAMWLLLLILAAGLFLIIKCVRDLRFDRHVPGEFHKDVVHVVDTRGVDAGVGRCLDNKSSMSRPLYAALLRYGSGRRDMEAGLLDECRRILFDLHRPLRIIFILAGLAFVVGLEGTSFMLMAHFDEAAAGARIGVAQSLIPVSAGILIASGLGLCGYLLRMKAADIVRAIEERAIEAVITLDRKARQSIRLIDDIEEQIPTKDMPAVKNPLPDLDKEFEEGQREGSGIKTSITTHANMPAATVEPKKAEAGR
ncbi:MAG TPA: hypothetical protein VEK08_24970 [Planctomycetota bacterium]|nr:hypothetical protein [Planctomycetota bacterium]